MPDYFSNDRRGRKRDGRGLADAPRGRGRTPGLAVVVCVIVALVHAQPTLPGDHGQEQAEQVTAPWTVTEWDDLMVPGVFAVTPGIWVTEVGGQRHGTLETMVGYNAGAGNRYSRHSCGNIALIDRGEVEFGQPAALACDSNGPFGDLDGACCGPDDGFILDNVFSSAGTVTFSSSEFQIPMGPPFDVTVLPFPGGSQISVDLDIANSHFVASTYDITNGEVDLFTRPHGGAWVSAGSFDSDSPMSDSVHWGMCAAAVGLGAYAAMANAAQASLLRVDLSTGVPVWSYDIGNIADPPNEFQYFGVNSVGVIELANGSSGEAVAVYFGDENGLNICVAGPTDQATPPIYTRCQQFLGPLPGDRHDIDGDGKFVYYIGPDPGRGGTRVILLNCGDLGGECSSMVQTIDGFTPEFTAFAPETIIVDGHAKPVVWEQKIVIAGGGGEVHYYTIDLPFAFYNFETGTLDLWDNVVGGTSRER